MFDAVGWSNSRQSEARLRKRGRKAGTEFKGAAENPPLRRKPTTSWMPVIKKLTRDPCGMMAFMAPAFPLEEARSTSVHTFKRDVTSTTYGCAIMEQALFIVTILRAACELRQSGLAYPSLMCHV